MILFWVDPRSVWEVQNIQYEKENELGKPELTPLGCVHQFLFGFTLLCIVPSLILFILLSRLFFLHIHLYACLHK